MIPAMTSAAEQACFERLAFECARYGAVVELGAWLGACTVAMARGIERSGADNVIHSYDRFRWDRSHTIKAGFQVASALEAYKQNVAPYSAFVHPHKGEITDATWSGGVISLMLCDGPKRFKPVQHALSEFGSWLRAGSVMAWQDFCFPPAYAIPASLFRLRKHFFFAEAMDYTVVLKLENGWQKHDVYISKLEGAWSLPEVAACADFWRGLLPEASYAGVVSGMAMFLSDLGLVQAARTLAHNSDREPLRRIRASHGRRMVDRYPDIFRGLD